MYQGNPFWCIRIEQHNYICILQCHVLLYVDISLYQCSKIMHYIFHSDFSHDHNCNRVGHELDETISENYGSFFLQQNKKWLIFRAHNEILVYLLYNCKYSLCLGSLWTMWYILSFGGNRGSKNDLFCAKRLPCRTWHEFLHGPSNNYRLIICHATYDIMEIGYDMVYDMESRLMIYKRKKFYLPHHY